MKRLSSVLLMLISLSGFAQVDTTFIYNTTTPFGTLDIRIAIPGNRLVPFQSSMAMAGIGTMTTMSATSTEAERLLAAEEAGQTERTGKVNIYPNPAESGFGELTISAEQELEGPI
jgi:hypothetical protein